MRKTCTLISIEEIKKALVHGETLGLSLAIVESAIKEVDAMRFFCRRELETIRTVRIDAFLETLAVRCGPKTAQKNSTDGL